MCVCVSRASITLGGVGVCVCLGPRRLKKKLYSESAQHPCRTHICLCDAEVERAILLLFGHPERRQHPSYIGIQLQHIDQQVLPFSRFDFSSRLARSSSTSLVSLVAPCSFSFNACSVSCWMKGANVVSRAAAGWAQLYNSISIY